MGAASSWQWEGCTSQGQGGTRRGATGWDGTGDQGGGERKDVPTPHWDCREKASLTQPSSCPPLLTTARTR